MGAFEDNAHVQGAPGAPVVRINGVAIMGGVDVKRPKNRRDRNGQGELDQLVESLLNNPDTLAWTKPAAPCTAG